MIFLIKTLDGSFVNNIVADVSFVEAYCAINGFLYEEIIMPQPEPIEEVSNDGK